MTKVELETAVAALFENSWGARPVCKVNPSEDGKFAHVEVAAAYEYVEVTIQALQGLSTLLQTEQIDLRDKDYDSGCETCDYGSEYRVTFSVYNSPVIASLPK